MQPGHLSVPIPNYDYHRPYHPATHAHRCAAHVAAQFEVGLRPERRLGHGSRDPARPVFVARHLGRHACRRCREVLGLSQQRIAVRTATPFGDELASLFNTTPGSGINDLPRVGFQATASLPVHREVPAVGVEPTLHCWNGILSPARLPIPPRRRLGERKTMRFDPGLQAPWQAENFPQHDRPADFDRRPERGKKFVARAGCDRSRCRRPFGAAGG